MAEIKLINLISFIVVSTTNRISYLDFKKKIALHLTKSLANYKKLLLSLNNNVLVIISRPSHANLTKVKTSIKVSFSKLKNSQKCILFVYFIFSVYRGVYFNPLFFSGVFLAPFYLFLFQQRRIKGFLRLKQRDTRVRLKHYREDFYYVWLFVNTSFVFLAICQLTIYYFEFISNYLLSTYEVVCPISLVELKSYTFLYFLFVLGVNWAANIYIIWFKNPKTFFKISATQGITAGAFIGGYVGLQNSIDCNNVEANPLTQYYYHALDPFGGRGFHYHKNLHVEQSNTVKAALGERFDPKLFLDEKKFFDYNKFLVFVSDNQSEIGRTLNDKQKAEFPSLIKWTTETSAGLKNSNDVVVGRILLDKDHRLVLQFQKGLEMEPIDRPANLDSRNSSSEEFLISGKALDFSTEFKEECMPVISPVASQESSTSSITSVGTIIVPGSNPRAK